MRSSSVIPFRVQVRSANDRAQGAVRFSEELRERLGQDWIPKVQDWWSSMAGRVGAGGGGATPPPPPPQQRQGAAKEGSKDSGPGPTGTAAVSSKEGRLFGWGLDLGAFSAFQQQLRPPPAALPPEAVRQPTQAMPTALPPVAESGGGSGLVGGQDPAAVRGDVAVNTPLSPPAPDSVARPGGVAESGRTPADYESRDGYVHAAPPAGPLGSNQMGFGSTPNSVSAPAAASLPVGEAPEHAQPVIRNVHEAAEVQLEPAGTGPVPGLGSPSSAFERDWREGPMSGSWEDLVSDPTRGTLPDSAGGTVLDVKD